MITIREGDSGVSLAFPDQYWRPSPSINMLTLITHIAIVPEKIDDFYAALIKYTASTRQAVGNLRYHPARDSSRPNHFSIVEIWKDQASEDAHEAAAPSKEFRAVWAP